MFVLLSEVPRPPTLENFMDINYNEDNKDPYNEGPQEESYSFLVKRTPIAFRKNRKVTVSIPEMADELFSDDDTSEEANELDEDISLSDDESEKDYCQVDFSAPGMEIDQNISEQSKELDKKFSWIVIWILKHQERYRSSDVATNSLIEFFRYVLMSIDLTSFANFPTSLYLARKKLGICVHLIKYAACNKCCKLYNIDDVSSSKHTVTPKYTECIYQDFPNHSMGNKRNFCNKSLYKNVHTKDGIIKKPALIFPTVNLKHQLNVLFKRKGFEESCRKWVDRPSDPEILADIYDGRVWKSFKNEDGLQFFRPDLADSHLGIMLSMDWFQPFENSQFSTGAIYAIICNLPCDERFKPGSFS